MRLIPPESEQIIQAAVRMLGTHEMPAEDVVRAIYYLGRVDGGFASADVGERIAIEAIIA